MDGRPKLALLPLRTRGRTVMAQKKKELIVRIFRGVRIAEPLNGS